MLAAANVNVDRLKRGDAGAFLGSRGASERSSSTLGVWEKGREERGQAAGTKVVLAGK